MKNRVLLVFLAMVLVVSLVAFAACAKEEEAPPVVEEEEEEVEVWEWPEKLIFAVTGVETFGYALTIGWTALMVEETGTTVRVLPIVDKLQSVGKGLFFSAAEGNTVLGDHLEGIPNATRDGGPWQMRILWPVMVGMGGYFVRGDSDIETPYDLKGKKIIWLEYVGPTGKRIMESLLAWGNIDPEDVDWVPAGSVAINARYLMDGRGDVAFGFPMTPAQYDVEASPHGMKWIDLNPKTDPEGAERFLQIQPRAQLLPVTMGVPSAIGKYGSGGITYYIVRADTDPELVYRMVKWLDENYDRYKDCHAVAPHMNLDNLMLAVESSFVPAHDGVIRYLREKGLWTAAHDARNQQNIDLITRYVEAYKVAIERADEEEIMVDLMNEEWIELWENYKKELDLPTTRIFPGLD